MYYAQMYYAQMYYAQGHNTQSEHYIKLLRVCTTTGLAAAFNKG